MMTDASGVVSRAELKLKEAAAAFGCDFRGKVVLDVGSSTGGFTEYALKAGAKKVIAVEKGARQMKAPLRFDVRVELHEKTDILDVGTLGADAQVIIAKPDIVMMDVSFTSVRPILTHLKMSVASEGAEYLVMLKPQFEARPEQLNRGVVKNERMRREICKDFEEWAKRNGFLIRQKRDNSVVGKVGGNRERFYLLNMAK